MGSQHSTFVYTICDRLCAQIRVCVHIFPKKKCTQNPPKKCVHNSSIHDPKRRDSRSRNGIPDRGCGQNVYTNSYLCAQTVAYCVHKCRGAEVPRCRGTMVVLRLRSIIIGRAPPPFSPSVVGCGDGDATRPSWRRRRRTWARWDREESPRVPDRHGHLLLAHLRPSPSGERRTACAAKPPSDSSPARGQVYKVDYSFELDLNNFDESIEGRPAFIHFGMAS